MDESWKKTISPDESEALQESTGTQPPANLPRVPRLFWSAHPDFKELTEHCEPDVKEVLECLGPPPFPKKGFPFIGFLATVYDHVVTNTPVGVESDESEMGV